MSKGEGSDEEHPPGLEKPANTAVVIKFLFLIIIFILPDAIQINMTDRHVRLQW